MTRLIGMGWQKETNSLAQFKFDWNGNSRAYQKKCLSRVWMKVLNHKLSMNICLVTVEIISVVISHNTVFEWIDVYLSRSSITVTNKITNFFVEQEKEI